MKIIQNTIVRLISKSTDSLAEKVAGEPVHGGEEESGPSPKEYAAGPADENYAVLTVGSTKNNLPLEADIEADCVALILKADLYSAASRGGERSWRCDETTTAAGGIEDDGGGEDPNDSELKGDSEGSAIDSSSRDTVIHSSAHMSTAAMDKPYAESSVSTPRTYCSNKIVTSIQSMHNQSSPKCKALGGAWRNLDY
ncbi:unnamed protein product [Heligmosomoides polygyrus]|uniref:Uncharacterized protein n=1 Tax=Heligmosomoides polygyrus TaxID=6339 RepID=A0A183FTR3_HELPZ|nr:unnamed protein product [Heligmosomoides polygyrus]